MRTLKRKLLKYKKLLFSVLLVLIVLAGIFGFIKLTGPLYEIAVKNKMNPFSFISLLLEREPNLKTSNNRSNIIILGVSGGNHEGPSLTDSNIFLSIDIKSNDIVMVSVPRDFYLQSLKTKINSVYYYGEQKKTGGGLIL